MSDKKNINGMNEKSIHKIGLLTCLLIFFSTHTAAETSKIILILNQNDVNLILDKSTPLKKTKNYKGKIGFIPWSVTPTFTVNKAAVTFTSNGGLFNAHLNIKGKNFSYTESVTAKFTAHIDGNNLLFRIGNIELPFYVNPGGLKKIHVTTLGVTDLFPDEIRNMTLDLSSLNLDLQLPNNKKAKIKPTEKKLIMREGYIEITSTLVVEK